MKNKIWFIADMHFSNPTQIRHKLKRGDVVGISLEDLKTFPIDELTKRYDESLIKLWNGIVKRGDFVYHVGDFCLGNRERTAYILSRLNGKKFFITGNHDKSLKGNERFLEGLWHDKEVKFNHDQFPFIKEGETFCVELEHCPSLAWNRRPYGSCHVHGHTHGAIDDLNDESLELRVDVGLDGRLANYGFVDLETLYAHFRGIVKKQGFDTFLDYAEWLMAKQGFRM